MKHAIIIVLLVLAFVAANAQDRSRPKPDRFDVPRDKKIVDFGPSFDKPSDTSPGWQRNAYRRARNKLTCYWFPTLMVKEYDVSQKGAAWVSFTPISSNAHPNCDRSHTTGEKVFEDSRDWEGYFLGVKDNFVFLTDADGSNGGIGFAVYDSKTGKKVFEDTDCLSCLYLKKVYGQKAAICSLRSDAH